MMKPPTFEWHERKNQQNQKDHGVSFEEAQEAFFDPNLVIIHDEKHSDEEERWFCLGRVGTRILTVRFTYRERVIRIIGAGQWRKWSQYYEKENHITG